MMAGLSRSADGIPPTVGTPAFTPSRHHALSASPSHSFSHGVVVPQVQAAWMRLDVVLGLGSKDLVAQMPDEKKRSTLPRGACHSLSP